METSVGQKEQYYLLLYCLRVNTKQDIARINSWPKKIFPIFTYLLTLDCISPSLSACPSFFIHLFSSTAHNHSCSLFLFLSFSFSFSLSSCPCSLCLFSLKPFDSLLQFERGGKGNRRGLAKKAIVFSMPTKISPNSLYLHLLSSQQWPMVDIILNVDQSVSKHILLIFQLALPQVVNSLLKKHVFPQCPQNIALPWIQS